MITIAVILSGLALFHILQAWEEFQILRRSYNRISWGFKNPEQYRPWAFRRPGIQTANTLRI